MHRLIKNLIGTGAVALLSATGARAQFTIEYDGGPVNDSTGSPDGDGRLVILIANESGTAGFSTLAPGSLTLGSLLDGAYQIIGETSTNTDFGTPGVFDSTTTVTPTGTDQNLATNDQLAVVWFPTVAAGASTLASNTSYGLYTQTDWVVPASGDPLVEYSVPAGENADLTSLSAVPEPSTYALIAGGAALGFAAWRRRRALA